MPDPEACAIPLTNAMPANASIAAISSCAGWSEVRTLICGDSHALALCLALQAGMQLAPESDPSRRLGLAGLVGRAGPAEMYRAALSAAAGRNVALVWRGNQHTRDFLAVPGPAFDFIPRCAPDAPLLPGAIVVPEALVRAHFGILLPELESLLKANAQLGARRLFVLGTPPPLCDTEQIRRWALAHPVLIDKAAELGLDLAAAPITAPSVRRKLWQVLQTVVAECAARQGAAFIGVPPAACDPDGFLLPHLSAGDATHANAAYGALMLAELARHLDRE